MIRVEFNHGKICLITQEMSMGENVEVENVLSLESSFRLIGELYGAIGSLLSTKIDTVPTK